MVRAATLLALSQEPAARAQPMSQPFLLFQYRKRCGDRSLLGEDEMAKRKPSAAFMKPMKPSAQLAEIVGDKPLPRTEVTKKIWAHIKRHKLQNPKNKREILADDKLQPIFGAKKLNMFEMTKAVNQHLK